MDGNGPIPSAKPEHAVSNMCAKVSQSAKASPTCPHSIDTN